LSVLLDTNICIAAINGRPLAVRGRIQRAIDSDERVVISSVTLFELWYGVVYSARVSDNAEKLELFLTTVETIPFDDEDARFAGAIRASLRRLGTPIGPYDCLIAAQAIRHNWRLVTANVREFSRVEGLRWEDWTILP
jgi:tRNA(fMet)-specific endonuclease VapC